ncbi:NAD(P)-binding domain-containing protein [Deinococcus aquatilis]|uniref:NAD(P)-binding domain-containing protein n=1 Tax=Deinococcus aquatilis TaxID=519440 RepID=UPI000382B31D|nr:NADPH-dependent F420 reductase [Deinococcus aquatilis]
MSSLSLALLVAVAGATLWVITRRRSLQHQTRSNDLATVPALFPLQEHTMTPTTNITIIGAGNMGKGIAHVAARGGYPVTIIDRNADDAASLASELQAANPGAAVQSGTLNGPLSDVVVLATWYTNAQEIAQSLKGQLAGKVVVDISNPLTADFTGLAIAGDTSAAEELVQLIPDARVIKAFNTTFAGTLVAGQVTGQPLDVLIAGNDQEAKNTIAALVNAGGLRGIDVGPLERARQLEGLGFLGIQLQFTQNTNFASAWKFLA